MGQEKYNKNAHISTANIVHSVAITLWYNFTLLLPNLFRIKHPSIVWVINLMPAVIIHEKYISYA